MSTSGSIDALRFRTVLFRNVSLPLALGVVAALLFIGVVVYLLSVIGQVERTDQTLSRAYALQNLDLEQEAAFRGFMLTSDTEFLRPYDENRALIGSGMQQLRAMVAGVPSQVERLGRVQALLDGWMAYAQEHLVRKRADPAYQIGAEAGRGRRLKEAVRREFDDFVAQELRLRQQHVESVNRNTVMLVAAFSLFMLLVGSLLAWRGRQDLLGLSNDYGAVVAEQQRQKDDLEAQAWLREGQNALAQRIATETQLGAIGHAALELLAARTRLAIGAIYLPEGKHLRRIAAWGWPAGDAEVMQSIPADRTLLAECAARRQQMLVDPVPAGYLRVSSSLGQHDAGSVALTPLEHEGRLCAVLEAGFLGPLPARDAELMRVAGGSIAASIESARYRQRLQESLEETQQLNEELQVQQEELRTANEELEEQSKALKESQAHLETQQAELEQTNERLSELADQLAAQRDELQQAQGELERRAAELERASRYKSEFLANMSHELRTPLNSSLILARLLADNAHGNLSEEQVKFAESIYTAGNDLLNLINDILDIAKVEAGKLEIRPEVVPLMPLADGLGSMFEPLAAKKGLKLELQREPGLPDTLYTDRQRLEQVLRNLLSNAVKFTEQGSVTLMVRPEGEDRVAFAVRDTGIGIAPEQQSLIFDAFQQADGTVSRRYGGTGLGLSISRDLARLLGGEIQVHSERGTGSTFTLTLPINYEPVAQDAAAPPSAALAAPAPVPTAAPAPSPAPARATPPPFEDDRQLGRAQRRSVLVIEDDTAFARVLYDLAHELGYHCLVAHEAEEGLRLADQLQPDAVLLDMRLPDGSGLSVLQRLKEQPATRHIPVHAMSVEDLSEAALQMGAVGYALKPTTREQLRQVFARLEDRLSRKLKHVLLVEDDARQRDSVRALIADADVEITAAGTGAEALAALASTVFDCMIIDLKLPDMGGQELLRRMASGESRSFPPVIVYTGRNLTRDEEAELLRYSRSIIIKGARSPERLLDEVTLFLHKVETELSTERQRMLRVARNRDRLFEGRRILVVDDDVRNIFALTSALEHKGAVVEVARNGIEAIRKLREAGEVDLVLMDIMMPEMDGYTAMQEIRREPQWARLPMIAVTAKAMREDQERCLKAGANDYLAKPIDLERLFSLMRVWMPKLERL